jgi:ABC-type lipoprotein release transport system permease subunit
MIARLAWRSLWRHRRRTVITVVSIGFGLALFVFSVSLAAGMYARLIDDAVRMQAGHVTVEHADYRDAPAVDLRVRDAGALAARIEALPGVEGTKRLVLGQGVARSGTGAAGVAVMGVEPAVEARTSPLARRLVGGRYLAPDDGARVVVGAALAERLDLAEGKKLVITTNDASGALVEALFRVAGVFRTGAEEVDGYVVQAPLDAVQRLYGLGADEVTQLGVVLAEAGRQRAVARDVAALVDDPRLAVRPWQEELPELAAFIRIDRTSDYIFHSLLLALVLFTIFNTLLMSVLEREREFAVLMAIGTSPAELRRQVLLESAYIGALGCFVGLVLGGTVAGLVQVYGLDLTRFYREGLTISGLAVSTTLHARVTARALALLGGGVFLATLLLGVWPMRRAGRVAIADVLR